MLACIGVALLASWLRHRQAERHRMIEGTDRAPLARLERSRVVIGDCVLYHEDAAFILPTLHSIDAVVTDPPYGIDAAGGGTIGSGSKDIPATEFEPDDWGKKTVAPELISQVYARARWQIIFGGNYYRMPPASCWLVWDKLNGGSFADCAGLDQPAESRAPDPVPLERPSPPEQRAARRSPDPEAGRGDEMVHRPAAG